jgi:hypothetical protein
MVHIRLTGNSRNHFQFVQDFFPGQDTFPLQDVYHGFQRVGIGKKLAVSTSVIAAKSGHMT